MVVAVSWMKTYFFLGAQYGGGSVLDEDLLFPWSPVWWWQCPG